MNRPFDRLSRVLHATAVPASAAALPARTWQRSLRRLLASCRHRARWVAFAAALALAGCAAGPTAPTPPRRSAADTTSRLVRTAEGTTAAPRDSAHAAGGPGWIDPNI